jgi:ABC-type uncharacterized transport system substrate-binding protein
MQFNRLKRRQFITLIGGAAAWPLAARAQKQERVRRIGIITTLPSGDPEGQSSVAALIGGLDRLGWIEGRNIHIERRFAGGQPDLILDYARQLVALSPDVIVAGAPPVVQALLRYTRSLPIVFATSTDPIGQGFVKSLAHPGGNVTGLSSFEFSMGGKWVQLLKEIAPNIDRAGVIFNPETAPYMRSFLRFSEAAAVSSSVSISASPVTTVEEIENTIANMAQEMGKGAIFPADAFTTGHYTRIVEIVAKHRLPAIYAFRLFAAGGGLVSYGIDAADNYSRVAAYVDCILKGEQPADLPVQQPNIFKLVINLKTAKALDLEVPVTLLARADEVIE